jgi:hypothetical protein
MQYCLLNPACGIPVRTDTFLEIIELLCVDRVMSGVICQFHEHQFTPASKVMQIA